MLSLQRKNLDYKTGNDIAPTNLHKSQVETYASQVAATFHFGVADDAKALVNRLGGKVHYLSLDEMVEESGSIYVHGQNDFDMVLPQYTSPIRDRFTIAHELGHYFLHSNQGERRIIATRLGSTRLEWEANWFAAQLLMPKNEFETKLRKTKNLAVVANGFDVSMDAAEVRRKSLGIDI